MKYGVRVRSCTLTPTTNQRPDPIPEELKHIKIAIRVTANRKRKAETVSGTVRASVV